MTPKLTDAHIYPDKMKKMKVSVAAQVLSQRVGAIMLMLSEWSGEYLTIIFNNDVYDI